MRMKPTIFSVSIAMLTVACSVAKKSTNVDNDIFMLAGTYTAKDSKGIYVYKMDTVTGNIKPVSFVETQDPSYLAISKNGKYVYSVSEKESKEASSVNTFSFDKEKGILTFLGSQPAGGGAPCHIVISPDGQKVFTANYMGGSLSSYQVQLDGILKYENTITYQGKGFDAERQTQPHIHFSSYSPDGKYVFVNDLGLDKIYKFKVEENHQLLAGEPASFEVKKGSGPRHLSFHPNQKWAYLITEISGDVDVFDYHHGNLSLKQSIKADSLGARGSADIHITPNGKFLYASNRLKGDGIAIFFINQQDGKLTKIGYQPTGIHPRNFAISPNGKFLICANRDSNLIQVFAIDKEGLLHDTHQDVKLSMPVFIGFVE